MRRIRKSVRSEWQRRVADHGLTYHTLSDGRPYWDESAYWEFTAAEVDRLEAATAEIQRIALQAGDYVIQNNRFMDMGIPAEAVPAILRTWETEPPALYGRLDLAYDGRSIKLLEYNADTPTALIEAAAVQWYWLEECFPEADQFNSLHEKLVAKWKDLLPWLKQPLYFGHDGSEEDAATVTYLRDTAGQAGHQTRSIRMHDIGWKAEPGQFVGLGAEPIRSLFKLYPWEWLLRDDFGRHALASLDPSAPEPMQWIEPIWKMMWSNKALLPILWELNPGHELLLPAYIGTPKGMKDFVRKPFFGREGKGVTVYRNWIPEGTAVEPEQAVPDSMCVYQRLASLAEADGKTAVLGSWLIDGEPAGMGIRESDGLVTTNASSFVPHLFR